MALPRGGGSTGQSIALLFRLLADGSQARAELKQTGADYAKEIRSIETLGQRALTILSRPVRGQGGFVGSLGISAARQALSSFANKDISNFVSTTDGAAKSSDKLAKSIGVTAAQSATAVVNATRLAKAYKFTREEVNLFEKALVRAGKEQVLVQKSYKSGVSGQKVTGNFLAPGELTKTIERLAGKAPTLEKFAEGFSKIGSAEDRAGVAAEVFGKNAAPMLASLESMIPATEGAAAGTGAATEGMVAAAAATGPLAIGIAAVVASFVASAVVWAVLFKIAKASAEADYDVAKLATSLGFSAENMSALDIASRKADSGGLADIRGNLNVFNRQLGEVATGNLPGVSRMLKGLGLDATELAKDNDTALIKVINRYNSLKDPTQKAMLLQRLFSDETGKVGLAFKAVGPDFEKYREQLRSGGILLTQQAADAAIEFKSDLRELEFQFNSLGIRFGRALVPEMVRGLRILTGEWKGMGSAVGIASSLIAAKVREQINSAVALGALLKTLTQVAATNAEFSSTFAANYEDFLKQVDKSSISPETDPQKIQDDQNKLDAAEKAKIARLEMTAEAQKTIEQSITEEAARQLKLRDIDRTTEANRRIGSLQIVAQAELDAVKGREEAEEKADLKAGETEANRQARLMQFRNQRLAIETKLSGEIEGIRAEQREKDREAEEQARADAVKIQRAKADAQVAILEDQITKDERLRETNLVKIDAIERGITAFERIEIEKRLANTRADFDLRKKIQAELTEFNIAAKAREERRKSELEQAGLDKSLSSLRKREGKTDVAHSGDSGVAARLRDEANVGVISFQKAEEAIKKIVLKGFDDRIKIHQDEIVELQKHGRDASEVENKLELLQQQRTDASEEADRAIRDGRQRDIDDFIAYAQRIEDIQFSLTQNIIALRIRQIRRQQDLNRERNLSDSTLIEQETTLAHEAEAAEHGRAATEIRDKIVHLKNKKSINAQDQAMMAAYYRELEVEAQRHADADVEIELNRRERLKEIERANPLSNRSLFGDEFQNELDATGSKMAAMAALGIQIFQNLSESAGNFKSMLTDAFSAVGQGLGDMVQQWALMGTVGPHALRKLAASVLASFAAQAIVKAIFLVGQGFEYAAAASAHAAIGDVRGALLYSVASKLAFKSALVYALVGGGAALAARGIAGNVFSENTASGGGGTTGSGSQVSSGPTKYNVGRGSDLTRIHITLEKGLVARQWVAAVDGNHPEVRDRIKRGAAE